MILWEEAAASIDRETPAAVLPRERLPARQGLGRWLAEDAVSRLDLPPFDKSAMDGFAVRAGGRRESYRVLETVAAGKTPTQALDEGAAVKVMTGAPVPEGTGRVIKVEDVREEGGSIRLLKDAQERNLCRQGEDLRRGDVVLRAGVRLGPVDVANLIGCGVTEVEVVRPARLAILSTGDELVDDPALAGPGRIMNTNGPMLRFLAEQHGFAVVSEASVPDDPARTLAALREARESADLVLFSGGVSAGDFDFVKEAFPQAGLRVHFTQVAIKPGKPTVFATAPGQAVFGLPGNPVAVFVTFHLFALRAAARLRGGSLPDPREVSLPLAGAFRRRRAERCEFVPCRLVSDGSLEAVPFHGSAHLAALSQADGFFAVPRGTGELAAGSPVRFLPLSLMGARA
ncbi:MAG: molybdopterin molybdotransferase MoeA [Elusimicrobia bacterium]|nr:molybdopterin molybdotransferase MoeA [Elusimicrobiota bacterium]